MKDWRGEAGVTLIELLAALAIGSFVLTAAAGVGFHMLRSWEWDTARAAEQRSFLDALDTITDSVHGAEELRVEGNRLEVKESQGESVLFFLDGDQLKAQRDDAVVILGQGVSGFDVTSVGSGVCIDITVGEGAQAEHFEIRSNLPPWEQDGGGAGQ